MMPIHDFVAMFYILFIVSIVSPCLGADSPKNQADSDKLARYTELHAQIYDDSPLDSLNLTEIKDMLAEMHFIENINDIQLREKIRSYSLGQYQNLVDECYRKNVLINTDATITDLLLQTYEYNSNLVVESTWNI